MKIIHTSDWHLGISLHNASLIDEQRYFIDYLINVVKDQKVDAVIIAGDVFDHSVSSSEAITLYNYAVTRLCNELGVPVVIAAGNHDGAARLASCNELLKKAGLYIYGKLTAEINAVEIGNSSIYPIPYFNVDEVKALYPEEKISSYADAMEVVLKNIKQNFKEGNSNILMCHCFVSGSVLSESDRTAMVGGSSVVPSGIFDGFDYVAMGHLHKAQDRGYNIRYSGSPIKYSFSEAGHLKTITMLEIEDGIKYEELEIVPLRETRIIRGTFDEVLEFANHDMKRDDFIKIEITDMYAGMEAVELFRTYYANLLNITGKMNETEENQLTVEELYTLSPKHILEKFYKETTGCEVTEEQLKLFEKAMESVNSQEVLQ
ncbi:MAG: exonuclease SbcCD subunit D [Sedimentibacter saalensis]|uniref:exonuclease SbcCD subunit D n=1 Tax=Sedimentibacter saalensis TaxID=130788 RepID=UPI002B2015E6|nr:exonuclease SbcCD subunit D [Sedimentibacter saalensis]MEA5093432.1 exonuclease SbcCD subunit D [Sedimentibacter saalensis]